MAESMESLEPFPDAPGVSAEDVRRMAGRAFAFQWLERPADGGPLTLRFGGMVVRGVPPEVIPADRRTMISFASVDGRAGLIVGGQFFPADPEPAVVEGRADG